MNSWSKIAAALLVAAGLSSGQTVPASGPSTAASVTPVGGPSGASATLPKPSPCRPGPAWLCVAQTLQSLIFNQDGTHRADADIATDVTRAIQDLIKDGIIKPQDAPAKPISGFDDANKYLDNYPTHATDSLTPVPGSTSPAAPTSAKPGPCPADRPWLCDTPPPAPVNPAQASAANVPSKTGTAPAKSSTPKSPAAAPGKPSAAGSKPASAAADPPPYLLGPLDVVQVSVFDENHVTGPYPIGPDGRISMPLIGSFKAIDMTTDQLTELLTAKLRDPGGILDPVVNVQLLRSNSKQYTLVGGTLKEGPQPLLRETTILDALTAAGGFKEFAKKSQIKLRRGTQVFKFNYNDVVKGKHMEQNILVQDGDLIIVPE